MGTLPDSRELMDSYRLAYQHNKILYSHQLALYCIVAI
uniref:Uncharacterized protein n=1 Tax=Arundo donax TaxID=35708 RepID=A0A0A9CQ23_ARUDO